MKAIIQSELLFPGDFGSKSVQETFGIGWWLRMAGLFVVGNLGTVSAAGQIAATSTNLHPAGSSYSYCNTTSGFQQGGQVYIGSSYHAAVWSGTSDSLVDLHPAGAVASWVNRVQGGKQVGYVNLGTQGVAAFWSGTAASYTDLNPSWASGSEALGVCSSQQVGWCNPTNASSGVHAVLWTGSPDSCVDLHPAFWKSSKAYASNGSNQVGYVEKYGSGNLYAAMWSGSAGSFVELGPEWAFSTSVTYSCATAMGGTNIVGAYQLYNQRGTRAALWTGNPPGFISLHPNGATDSSAWETTDTMQVGTATVNGQLCLAIWHGTPESFVNLGPFATGFGSGVTDMTPRGMWIEGNVIHVVGDQSSRAISCAIHLLPPLLKVDGAQVQGSSKIIGLSWTNNGAQCVLEYSDGIGSGWQTVTQTPTTEGNMLSTGVTNAGSAGFFRLRGT